MMLIEALDAAGAAAVPAEATDQLNGWTLRHTHGLPLKRANSIYPRRHVDGDLAADVAFCEGYYGERGLPVRFQVSPASQPDEIADVLLGRGYEPHSPTGVYVSDLSDLGPSVPTGRMTIELTPAATEEWWSTAFATLEIKPEHQPSMARLFERVDTDSAFVRVVRDDIGAGVGRGVLADDRFGIFDIATVPQFRRNGVGRLIVDALMQWARRRGARTGYLQVETRNEVAVSLYRRAGFQTLATRTGI